MSKEIRIGRHLVGLRHPAYFIADIAANHDGDLNRAKDLIHLCAEAGADAAKFGPWFGELSALIEGANVEFWRIES